MIFYEVYYLEMNIFFRNSWTYSFHKTKLWRLFPVDVINLCLIFHIESLRNGSCHDANFFITDDSVRYHRWCQCWYHDNFRFSVNAYAYQPIGQQRNTFHSVSLHSIKFKSNPGPEHTCLSSASPVYSRDLNLVITVPADGLAPSGARPLAGPAMTTNMLPNFPLTINQF